MADPKGFVCNNRFWHGTRTYIMSERTNPPPHQYIADLTAAAIRRAEKAELIGCCQRWPGATTPHAKAIVNATIADIQAAHAID